MIIESLERFHHYHGDDFKVEHPTGSGNLLTLREIAHELSQRMITLFTKKAEGNRPIYRDSRIMQENPHFENNLLFHEYFDGDSGRVLGANHQTGWTGLVAKLIQAVNTPRKK